MICLRSLISIAGSKFVLETLADGMLLVKVIDEICSPLNFHGTQIFYSVHCPSMRQLTSNYVQTGGFQRFLDRMGFFQCHLLT